MWVCSGYDPIYQFLSIRALWSLKCVLSSKHCHLLNIQVQMSNLDSQKIFHVMDSYKNAIYLKFILARASINQKYSSPICATHWRSLFCGEDHYGCTWFKDSLTLVYHWQGHKLLEQFGRSRVPTMSSWKW